MEKNGPEPLLLQNGNGTQAIIGKSSEKKLEAFLKDDPLPPSKKRNGRFLSNMEKLTLATLCYINLLNYMDRFTLAAVLDKIGLHFDLSNEAQGLVQTVYTLAYMIFASPFGYWGDRHSRKWGMIVGVGIWSGGTLLGSFVGSSFEWFLVTRALVGLGQASFSTLAPTVISDMVAENQRSRFLALFYFLLPIGSGFGYIVGAGAASVGGSWEWSLRVTPFLGLVALILLFVSVDPARGAVESEETEGLVSSTTYIQDIHYLLKNRSFMLSTGGFTCVAFVSGALAWWGPFFLAEGFSLQPSTEEGGISVASTMTEVSFQFGIAMMLSGLIGVPIGSILSQKLRKRSLRADPLICAVGMLLSAPILYAAAIVSTVNTLMTLILIFFGMLFLNLSWCIVADILLYTVVPTRRSAAQGLQILISFALGAAGSPYLIGLISDVSRPDTGERDAEYQGLNVALYLAYAVEILGGIFFLLTAIFVVQDKADCDRQLGNGSGRNSENGNGKANGNSEPKEGLNGCS